MVALENRNNKILNEAQEDAITNDYMAGGWHITYKSIGLEYGVSPETIARAIERAWTRQGERTKKRFEDEEIQQAGN